VAFTKGDKARFGEVEAQPELSQSHRKDPEEAVGVVFALEEHQGVIGVADHGAIAATVARHDPGEPLIQDAIEQRLGDDRRDHRALRATQFIMYNTPRGLRAGCEHPRNQAQKRLIHKAFREPGTNLPMRHGLEKLGEIEVRNPVDWFRHHLLVELMQGVMTAPPWSASVRRVKAGRVVERFQDAACQVLDALIFRATDSQAVYLH
jgi:hypothetical protein